MFLKNLPVYERGGKAKKKLWFDYRDVMKATNKKYLRRESFEELAGMKSKKGESKIGVSTYYVKLRYYIQIIKDI